MFFSTFDDTRHRRRARGRQFIALLSCRRRRRPTQTRQLPQTVPAADGQFVAALISRAVGRANGGSVTANITQSYECCESQLVVTWKEMGNLSWKMTMRILENEWIFFFRGFLFLWFLFSLMENDQYKLMTTCQDFLLCSEKSECCSVRRIPESYVLESV